MLDRLAALLLVAVTACDCDPNVGAIDIVPPLVHVRADAATPTTFRLEARLWTGTGADRKGIPETEGVRLEWASGKPWLKVKRSQGHTVTLELKPGYSDTDREAVITATAAGQTSDPSARVVVLTDGSAPGNDTLRAQFVPDVMPNVAVVSGLRSGSSECPESLFAFVRTTPLGQLDHKCGTPSTDDGNAAVLAVGHGTAVWSESWTPSDDGVMAVQGARRSLPIAVWVAMDGRYLAEVSPAALMQLRDSVRDQAREDIREANTILQASRAGIILDTIGPSRIVPESEIPVIGDDCWDADAIASSYTPATLNVYYIEEMPNRVRGAECVWHNGRDNTVIYVTWTNHVPTTLVHEVGHALSLTMPGRGHTFEVDAAIVPGFDPSNVMASGVDDRDYRGRDRFTAGQVFRMNTDSASWLNVATTGVRLVRESGAPRLGCQCQVDDRSPCPRLVDDPAPPSPSTITFDGTLCSDEVLLRHVNVDDAVGLLAGRRWRSPPTVCASDLPGRRVERWGATGLLFENENLTRPGICPSWVVAFFRQRTPLYVVIEEIPDNWLDTRDKVVVLDSPGDRWDVPVHVWYATDAHENAMKALAHGDSAKAVTALGEPNRSGTRLAIEPHPVPSIHEIPGRCAPNQVVADEINVYYVHTSHALHQRVGMKDGARCFSGGTDVIVISTNAAKHDSTALGHYLGVALGLSRVTTAAGLTADNLMWRFPNEGRVALTLGQVFRVHFDPESWLNRSLRSPRRGSALAVYECDQPPDKHCPALRATVPE